MKTYKLSETVNFSKKIEANSKEEAMGMFIESIHNIVFGEDCKGFRDCGGVDKSYGIKINLTKGNRYKAWRKMKHALEDTQMITDKEIICRINIKETDTGQWIAYDTKTFLTISDEYKDYSECLKDVSNGLIDYTVFK